MLPRNLQLKPPYPFVRNDGSPQASGLILWWPGEPSMGGKLWDLSNGLQHGSLTGFANPFTRTSGWLDGKDGGSGAVVFDGTDDMVSLTTTQTATRFYFSATQAYSVSFWIKPGPAVQPNATPFLLGVRNAPAGPDGSGWFCYYDKPTAAIYWDYYGGTGNGTQLHQRLSSASSVPASVWTQVTCTRDNTNTIGGTKIYINGLINAGTTTDLGPAPTNPTYTAALGLGKNPQNSPNAFLGAMEDVRIYNRALTAKEAAANFDSLTRWELRFQPGKKRYFIPDPIAEMPYYESMECAYATTSRGESRLDGYRQLQPSMAPSDPISVADFQLTPERFPSGDWLKILRDMDRRVKANYWKEPVAEVDAMALAFGDAQISADRYVTADANELIRQLFALPRSNFWKEPMQATVDDQALTVPNPEQEQSKFVSYEAASRALFYKRWLQSRFWNEPMQSRIDPAALMLIDPVDATYSRVDMQDIRPHAAFLANDRRRHFSSTFGQTDLVTLALQEAASADKFTSPWQMRLLPRPPVTYTYGHSINEPSLIPEDPPSLFMRSWWTALAEPVRLPVGRRPRHFFPVGTLDLDEAQRPETIYQAFEGPWRSPRWTRPIRGHFYPIGDLGIDNADRPERISVDEFRRLFHEPMRVRARILAGQVAVAALLINPSLAGETITVDKYSRPFDVPHGKAELFHGLMQIAVSEYDASTFSQPAIVKFIRSMLNAGF